MLPLLIASGTLPEYGTKAGTGLQLTLSLDSTRWVTWFCGLEQLLVDVLHAKKAMTYFPERVTGEAAEVRIVGRKTVPNPSKINSKMESAVFSPLSKDFVVQSLPLILITLARIGTDELNFRKNAVKLTNCVQSSIHGEPWS